MRRLEYNIIEDIIIKDFIKVNISKKFYRYLKRVGYKLYLNNKLVNNYDKAFVGDILLITYNEDNVIDEHYYKLDLDIIYECNDFLVIYKPSGLKTIPTGHNDFISLYNALLYYYKINNIKCTIHFINRLDKDTEGLLLVAKNKITANLFSKDLNNISRKYLSIVEGIISNDGYVNVAIKKGEGIKRIVDDSGKYSLTKYKVLKYLDNNTLLELELSTGRCHQIRVHMSFIGHPIVGDSLYGNGFNLYLCSYYIKLKNPFNNEILEFKKYPKWFV